MKKNLTSSEWFLAASLLAIMASLVAIAKINSSKAIAHVQIAEAEKTELIPVSVYGAVAKPGAFLIEKGTPLAEAVHKAKPTRFADLKNVPLDQIIDNSLTVHIEELAEIEIHISGAIAIPGFLRLPTGTRVCDLKSKIEFAEGADRSVLKSRRILKEGERIEIPRTAPK